MKKKKPALVTDKNQLDGGGAGPVSGDLCFALLIRAEVKVAIGPQVEHKLEGIF